MLAILCAAFLLTACCPPAEHPNWESVVWHNDADGVGLVHEVLNGGTYVPTSSNHCYTVTALVEHMAQDGWTYRDQWREPDGIRFLFSRPDDPSGHWFAHRQPRR